MRVMGLFSKDDIITSSKNVLMWETQQESDSDWRCAGSMAEDSNLPTCYFLATSGTKTYEGEYHWATGR